ncbi:Uncharacterised protein [Sebaldella termitidis]|jgi:uncharacterized membrane protein YozB (DUF420 family)|uniref:DUF5362 domain-containing protein n=1 Tax=Sebaldella termitidis (strain ATCC 33386 / NCTC 11300) TaxID=526218 RepID=D1ANF0_SEBTE|nr:DUF5362 domain-containing protein [Sebaldella termitidis]ACZ09754.1 hypothetical protein Sterm_2910 [Sebaldella termitidis ATCC 33386]SUI25085.1 Uncharacterised protein [Sebaldella termitidis]
MNDLEELYSKSSFDTSKENPMTVQLDEVFKKKLGFLGTFQQVMGVLAIIYGAFLCIGIFTAIVGVPVILVGIKVFKSGGAYKDALMNSSGEDLKRGLCELSDASKIYLVLLIIGIVVSVIICIFFMGAMIAALSQPDYYY